MATRALLLVLLAGSAIANPSPFCGRWLANCVPDYTTTMFINTSLTTNVYTHPVGPWPTVDYAGTFGSVSFYQEIYNASSCQLADRQAQIYRFGDWVDKGPADKQLFREIALSPTSMKIKPLTDAAVAHLQFNCPCGNASAWQKFVLRTLTKCAGNTCTLPWINYTNVGTPQYGIARVDAVTTTMNVSSFSADSNYPSQDTLYQYNRDENCSIMTPNYELCGAYSSQYDCRASTQENMDYNVKVSFALLGNDVGTFNMGYDYYQQDDVNCQSEFVGSFHTTGTYALHGPSNCSGTCNGASAIEVFATSATFKPGSQPWVDLLNDACPCNGTWSLNQARTISVCPISTCSNLASEEFTHGIPVGTINEAYGNVIAFSDILVAVTRFSLITDDYSTSFDVKDHALTSLTPDPNCDAGKTLNELTCGQYISSCVGSADKTANYEENTTFFGPGKIGEFRRVYRQFAYNDRFCSGPATLEYVLTGTYNLASPSTCEDCNNGAYTQFEVTITRAQFTLNTQEAVDLFQQGCPCTYNTKWLQGVPNVITVCSADYGCGIDTFPGINGLTIGTVTPSYGTITRFDSFVAMTELSSSMSTGFSQPFTSKVPILFSNPQFTDCPAKASNDVCGVYRDSCRGMSGTLDDDNVVRSMTLYGQNFGEYTIIQSIFQGFDVQCNSDNVLANIEVYGTFALHGPSDCTGSCSGLGAQKIEMTVAHTSITFYNQAYLNTFAALCPCDGSRQWELEQPQVFGDCPAGTCNFDIRGLMLGSSDSHFGSLLRFGDMATLTLLNPSSVAGYAIGFTSEDQAVTFDPSTAAATCPAPTLSGFCGAYESACSGYGGLNSTNTIETISLDGNLTGTFTRTFKKYSAAQVSRCSSLVLASWSIVGTYAINGTSTCGGTCNGSALQVQVTSATIMLTLQSDVDTFNANCACGGTWVVGKPRTLGTTCDRCVLNAQAGAHGLDIGSGVASYASMTLNDDRFSVSIFHKNPNVGFSTPFDPTTDRVYISNPTTAADSLFCAGYVAPSGGASSSSDNGLSAGDGLLIAFFCILGVYVIGGMALNYRAGATGVDLVPHLSFWKGIPGLVATGFRFTFIDCFGLRGNSAGESASYKPMASSGTGYGSM